MTETAKLNYPKFNLICFTLIGLVGLIFMLNPVKVPMISREMPLIEVKNRVQIPSEEDLGKLELELGEIETYLARMKRIDKTDMEATYEQVLAAPVCSIANRNFNTLEEQYFASIGSSDGILPKLEHFQKEYDQYQEMINAIPNYSKELKSKKQAEFEETIVNRYEKVYAEGNNYLADLKELESMYMEAKKIADDFFEEYYYWMAHIVDKEAGASYCTAPERACVANVIENRIKSGGFPDNVYDVIFQPGQYEPVIKGTVYLEPNSWTWKDVEDYLRGRIDTGMPDNVVYQALFTQGRGVWKVFPSGNTFCYG